VIDDRDADREAAADRRRRWCGDPRFLEVGDDLRVQPVGVVAAMAEADDVERNRRQQLEFPRGGDLRLEIAGERAASRDRGAERLGAVGLEREPGLEGAEAAGKVGAEIARPGRSGGKAVRLAPQIGGRRGEGVAMQGAVAHQDEAGVVGHLQPFVEVEGK